MASPFYQAKALRKTPVYESPAQSTEILYTLKRYEHVPLACMFSQDWDYVEIKTDEGSAIIGFIESGNLKPINDDKGTEDNGAANP